MILEQLEMQFTPLAKTMGAAIIAHDTQSRDVTYVQAICQAFLNIPRAYKSIIILDCNFKRTVWTDSTPAVGLYFINLNSLLGTYFN